MDNVYLAQKIKVARMRQDFLRSRNKPVPDEISIVAAMDYEQALIDDEQKARDGKRSERMVRRSHILAAKLHQTINGKKNKNRDADDEILLDERAVKLLKIDPDEAEKRYREQVGLEEKEIQEAKEFRDIQGLAQILEEEGFGEAADVVLAWFGVDEELGKR